MDNSQFRFEAFKNNTFDLNVLEKSLEESKITAYQHLRKFQLDNTGYRRFDFKMQDIYRTNKVNHSWSFVPRRWLFYLEYDFINVGKRISYKRSDVYEKDLSYDDIINRTNLFDYSFLVFIDGKLFTEGIKILCKEDKTYVVFTCKEKPSDVGIPINDIRKYLEDNVDVTILFLPNVGLTNISTNAYRVKTTNDYDGLPYRNLNLSEKAVYDNTTLSYIKFKDEMISIPTTVRFGYKGLFVDQDDIQDVIDENPQDTSLNIQLIPLRYILEKVVIGNGDKWFKLPIKDYPIAVENCLVFDSEGNFIHKAEVRDYYINVYSVENIDEIIEEKEIHIYVFYYENKQSILKHQNILEVYHKYNPNFLDKYKDDTILDIVKNYEPEIVDYDIKNFSKYNEYDDHFKYKIEKMWEFIKNDVNNFRRYLYNLGLQNNYYYVDVSKVDLESKRRTDNSDTNLALQTFDEEMYMFVFRNDFRGMYDKLLVTLDGLRYETISFYRTENLDFIYIPCRLVNNDSIIEIEKLTEVIREFEFNGGIGDVVEINIGDFAVRNKTLFNDLYIVDKENNVYIDPKSYEILHVIDGKEVNISTSDVFLPCTKIVKIRITDSKLFGRRLALKIRKNFRMNTITDVDNYKALEHIPFKEETKNDYRYFRLYRNGRLVPRHLGSIRFRKGSYEGEVMVFPGFIPEEGDTITVEVLPYMMTQVCYLEKLEKNKMVDLEGLIDKPFDFKWYDVYLNGKKLSKKEVEIISANKIKINDTKSLRWLEIIENSRDKEYFGYQPIKDIIDDLLRVDKEFEDAINGSITGMEDVEKPVVNTPVNFEDYILKQFYTEYMIPTYGLINPDEFQLTQDILDYYSNIMDGEPFLLNPDYGQIDTELILNINPDID